jgi:hypothetical protein
MAKVRSVTYRHRKKGRLIELELMKPLHNCLRRHLKTHSLAKRSPIPGISCRLLVKAGLRLCLLPCFERSFKPSARSESTGRKNPRSPQYAETRQSAVFSESASARHQIGFSAKKQCRTGWWFSQPWNKALPTGTRDRQPVRLTEDPAERFSQSNFQLAHGCLFPHQSLGMENYLCSMAIKPLVP